jgi:hypothetical protein
VLEIKAIGHASNEIALVADAESKQAGVGLS